MHALYNEIDKFAARWLENLTARGHVAAGTVDRRSIVDLAADDVAGPGQRHFFAGIGGWSYALRLAGVPDTSDIWTGSCPCQPFSDAGKRGGTRDARHLWPAWFELIRECRPATIFGEQVASRDGLGWLDLVRADLERCGYAFGASDLCAAGVGAPHIRQRLYFVAYAADAGRRLQLPQRGPRSEDIEARRHREAVGLADSFGSGRQGQDESHGRGGVSRNGCQLGNPSGARSGWNPSGAGRTQAEIEGEWKQPRGISDVARVAGPDDPWCNAEWIACSDGVSRPIEPGLEPLVAGLPGRVGLLRGYGNAIVPQVAARFIRAALDVLE